jgi:hypothetical protein
MAHVALVIGLALSVWWFWFVDKAITTTLISIVGCGLFWKSSRDMILNDSEMIGNVFTWIFLYLGAFGVVSGVSFLIFK